MTFVVDQRRSIDILCMGRVAVDLYAEQIGSSLHQAQTFRKYLGGCAGNIAVGASRLGLKSSMLSRVGDDEMGLFLRNTLKAEGVSDNYLKRDEDHLTALVLLGVNPPDRFPLMFYRNCCADNQICLDDIEDVNWKDIKSLLITGTSLAEPNVRKVVLFAIRKAKAARVKVILDIDYRPVLWGLKKPGDGETRFVKCLEVSKVIQDTLADSDLVVGTEEEFCIASAQTGIAEAVVKLRSQTDAMLVLKRGAQGCEVYLPGAPIPLIVPGYPVNVLNVLGAGDAFLSGFVRGLLRGEPILTCSKFGNANGAIVVSRHGCSPAMATFDELQEFMKTGLVCDTPPLRTEHSAELLIFAFDHREQFHATRSLSSSGLTREPIFSVGMDPQAKPEDDNVRPGDANSRAEYKQIIAFKNLLYEAFKRVNEPSGAILVDAIFGSEVLRQATRDGAMIGAPIEKANTHPLAWISEEPLYRKILARPQAWFVKVLVRYHPSMFHVERIHQISHLQELTKVCRSLERKLMIELLMPDGVKNSGENMADAISSLYAEKISAAWWKITSPETIGEWRLVTDVLDSVDSNARIVLLGHGAELAEIEKWFRIAKTTHHVVGFAIGRSIFWEAWNDFRAERVTNKQVVSKTAELYAQIINLWKTCG